MEQCFTCKKAIEGPDVVRADYLVFCNEACAELWLNIQIAKEIDEDNKISGGDYDLSRDSE